MNAKQLFRWTVLISAPVLLTGLPAYACGGEATCPCQTIADAVAQLSLASAQDANGQETVVNVELLGEQEFVREALETSAGKVLLGQLAQQKSQSDDVKQFSKQMTHDYGDLSEQVIERVAKLLEVANSKSLSKKDKQLAASLGELSGPQFDDQYIKLMIKSYKQDLKRFSSEANVAPDRGVKVTAEIGTSIATQHLKELEQIAEHHGANSAEMARVSGE